MRRIPLFVLALALVSGAAEAQVANKSVKLNSPILASQHLVTVDETDLENDSYTIEAWIHPTTFTGFPTIVGNDWQFGFWFGLDNATGVLRFWPVGNDDGDVMLGATPIPTNVWTHVAATYNATTGTARLYINGQMDAQVAGVAGATTSLAPLCLGADRSNNGPASFFFRGWLDEVRIWGRVLGTTELAERRFHRAGTPRLQYNGVYDGLEAYWDMEDPIAGVHQDRWEGAGHVANDASPVNGSSLSTTVVPPLAYNHSLYLGGQADFAIRDLPPGWSFADGLTIEAWVAPQLFPLLVPDGVLQPIRTIVGRSQDESFWLGLSDDSRLRFYPSGGSGQYFQGTSFIVWNEWTHVAAVYRPGLAELYVNGVLEATSTDFTTPPVENGVTPLIGADPPGGPAPADAAGIPQQRLFRGWLDEVRVTGAALSATTIREGMFRSSPPVEIVADELGVPRTRLTASLDPNGPEAIYGPDEARFDRSGAPVFGLDSDLASAAIHGYRNELFAQVGNLPGGAQFGFVQRDLVMSQNFTINDVNAFVSMSATALDPDFAPLALEHVEIELQHPGLTITLMNSGDGRGRDLLTVFDDEAPVALAAGVTPYVDGVRPAEALSNLDGFPSSGTWHLNVTCDLGYEACVWAWGVSFNDAVPLDATTTPGREFGLRLAGANPVRGEGALVFTLPDDDRVRLRLFDASGREVRTLLQGAFRAGEHRVTWNAAGAAPGLYFVRLERASGASRTARVAIVR